MKLLIVVLLVGCAAADVSHIIAGKTGEANAQIIRQDQDVGLEGQYRWAIETDNGIRAQEEGALRNVPGAEGPSEVVQGSASWTAPGGEVVDMTYTADENGYNAQGSHIPVPPPIPDPILRALEYIRTHPPKDVKLSPQ